MINRSELLDSLKESTPPIGMKPVLQALWHDRKGDWDKAHQIAQDIPGADGALIHAYLHRKEGDQSNSSYWYNRAGRPKPDQGMEEEWDDLVDEFLKR